MNEQDPFRLSEDISDEDPSVIPDEQPPEPPRPQMRGEEVARPKVPLVDGFDPDKVTGVVRLEPDHSDRDAIREEGHSRGGRSTKTSLFHARQNAPNVNSGLKGKGRAREI